MRLVVCLSRVPDPETIVDAFEAEFAALQTLIAHPADGQDLQPNAVSDDGHGQQALLNLQHADGG